MDVLTASAQLLHGANREQYALQYKTWQDELWAYTKSIGEYGSAMDWYANGFGRMHLTAAVLKPNRKEPEVLEEGPAADLVNDLLSNAEGGETQFLKTWGKHLATPGVGYFVAEDTPEGRSYDVKSAKVIKRATTPFRDDMGKIVVDNVTGKPLYGFDVQYEEGAWRQIGPSSIVGRIFDPDPEYDYLPTSPSRTALTTLREIDLYNRHIVATLLSRIVFNGILFIPEEVTFPVNPQFKDAPDPFIAELVAIASRGIKDPGSPASALPVPLRVPAQWIDKFKHLLLASGIDPRIISARAQALTRLTQQLPVPPEAITGVGDMNHWNAWQADADRVKMYFGAPMEVLCGGLTKLFLRPMLRAGGHPLITDEGHKLVVWYDCSDLTAKPDNSVNVKDAFDRIEVSSEVYRTGVGLDDSAKPSKDEARIQILTKLASNGQPVPDSFYLLYPEDKPKPVVDPLTPGADVDPTDPNAPKPAPGEKPTSTTDEKTPPKKEPAVGA